MLQNACYACVYCPRRGGIAKNGGRVSPPKNNFAKNASKRSRINALADLLILSEAMTGG